jgi:hypothetical protein
LKPLLSPVSTNIQRLWIATSRSSGGAPTPANGELFIFARVGWGRLRLYHSYLGLGFALFRSPRFTLTRCLTVDSYPIALLRNANLVRHDAESVRLHMY